MFDRLLPLVYDELRIIAGDASITSGRGTVSRRPPSCMRPTSACSAADSPSWNDRGHFFSAAAEAMRRILIDHARKRGRVKRGGGRIQVTLGDVEVGAGLPLEDLLALDDAIQRLEGQDPRMAEIVRLRFFAGLSVEETAKALEVSERTVKREWAVARAWLFEAMRESES